jgi:hypothetical protein
VRDESRTIAPESPDAVAALPAGKTRPVGHRVSSVVSSSDYNVLLDAAGRAEYRASITSRISFDTLRSLRT